MRYSRAGVVTSPPSGPRSNGAGSRPRIVRAPRNAKADRCRRGAPRGADASADASHKPGDNRATRVTGSAFSARHTPHRGDGKRDGPPRARPKTGASIALAFFRLVTRALAADLKHCMKAERPH